MYRFNVFFFKQKTAYEMRISDWSSDVCSSDLEDGVDQSILAAEVIGDHHFVGLTCRGTDLGEGNARIASAGEEPLGSDHQMLTSSHSVHAARFFRRMHVNPL